MSLFKKVFVTLLVIFLAFTAIGWFLPKHYQVERNILINAPPAAIYSYIVDLKAWPRWGVWFQRDPQMEIHYAGPDRAIGMRFDWKSESQENGEVRITALEHNRRVAYSLYFPEYEMRSAGQFLLEPVNEGTRVTWTNQGEGGNNPYERYFLMMMDDAVGPDFEMGLQNLKIVVENG